MSLYIVEDDYGNVLDSYGDFNNSMINAMLYDEPSEPERDVDEYGGHVVELVEAPAKVVVSEEEAEMLERAKVAAFPAHIFDSGAAGSLPGSQDRLMRAYVIGWTVERPKRYIVLMRLPGEKAQDGTVRHYMRAMRSQQGDYIWWIFADADGTCKSHRNDTFTAAEIEHYGLQHCERKEVTDDDD